MFKMGSIAYTSGQPDLSHHINSKSRARHPSPLKEIIKFMGQDGMISLAGGLPHPSMFPLLNAKFDCLPPLSDPSIESNTVSLDISRNSTSGKLDLNEFLQYGSGAGNKKLLSLTRDLTERMHAPPCEYECLLHPGNTNAWSKVVGLLCEDDDYVIVDEFTYPSAQALWIPLGIKATPVSADEEGLSAKGLQKLLESWDEAKQGRKRPSVLYLVPVGSNPTGVTISLQRRREIYAICVEFDVIIVEDDPYYCLQYPQNTPSQHQPTQLLPPNEFLNTLIPSFLSMDIEGRVIRLESFSKTLFPGLRLGYFVANPLFTERLLRATEVETQDPAGLSQAFVLALFENWGVDGYLSWLQGLQLQYKTRKDWLISAFHENFVVLPAAKSPLPHAKGYVCCIQESVGGKLLPVFSFEDPEAGMFVWSKFYFHGVPRFTKLQGQSLEDPEQAFAQELWEAMAAELVLLTPGSYYHAWQGADKVSTVSRGAEPQSAHFRFSFATPSKEQIQEGVKRVRKVVGQLWGNAV
ncbi:PLP-dependent transferase [Aaosphaeria arxii CBS 175.79]|uniref:PLP-dependent transferase n=1 Tax=Aaosphaeria arxii CBS 175.79 TaxID=1450172 RepID=A0A6A5Y3U4_9PLEO|nr:PLP-dependent transferase [Aaosphaeria arxii CBS 175.79]KAF2020212.1 PLP-dependent transferase [Aaosphaeria arxii CBS 175.79]